MENMFKLNSSPKVTEEILVLFIWLVVKREIFLEKLRVLI